MRRLLGFALVMHGLAHAAPGMWVATVAPIWVTTALWYVATAGFLVAGIGLFGIPRIEKHWRPLASMSAIASLTLLTLSWHSVFALGAAFDVLLLLDAIPALHGRVARVVGFPVHPPHRHLTTAAAFAGGLLVTYVSTALLLRPWHMRWGTTSAEAAMRLPGDEAVPNARYRIDHAVTIHAPADSIWPWLVQLGQDRAGFYSYDWLERIVGDPVHNADRIVAEWQHIEEGALVRATPPDYLGGIFGSNLGWRVKEVIPGRSLILDGWGAFVIQPVDDHTSRLLVRTRGEGRPSLAAIPIAPIGLLLLEPAHFIMERGMLLGIKQRAESRRPARYFSPRE